MWSKLNEKLVNKIYDDDDDDDDDDFDRDLEIDLNNSVDEEFED